MKIKRFFDPDTATFTYVVSNDDSNKCVIIDPILDYDLHSARVLTKSADELIKYLEQEKLQAELILETHIHADHLTAASYLRDKLGAKIGIGENIKEVLEFWVPIFNIAKDTDINVSGFDYLFKHEEVIKVGSLEVKVIHTPGHTPACVSYLIGNSIFVGDTIFMPHIGTARADFPGGSADILYDSIQKIFSLPNDTKVYTCHDYPKIGNEAESVSTILEQKQENIMVNDQVTKEQYIASRNTRDADLPVPKLLLSALQFNLRAGSFGRAEDNGVQYIKIPINQI